jgi:hypothetical protein
MSIASSAFLEERLFRLPPGCSATGATSTQHVFGIEELADGRVRFHWDGVPGQPFDELASTRTGRAVYWSRGGTNLAFVGVRGGRFFVTRDGVEEGPYDTVSNSVPPTFSPDGRSLVYGASSSGSPRLVRDGQEIGQAVLAPIQAVFSPDGSRSAYVEYRESPEEAYRIVVDDAPRPWGGGMRNAGGAMQFSPDGSRFAYYWIDGKGGARWVVDEHEQQVINDNRNIGLAQMRGIAAMERPLMASFSPDGRRFAYVADVLEKGVAVVEDDQRGALFRAVGWPVFSPDSARLAYHAQTFEKRSGLVVDGSIDATFPTEAAGIPTFSADSGRVALSLMRRDGGFLRKRETYLMLCDDVVLGERQGTDASDVPVFSPDGSHLAWWVARGDDRSLLVDGNVMEPAGGLLGDPAYTSSGRLVHPSLGATGATIFVDGRGGPVAEALVAPTFLEYAPDSMFKPFEPSPDGDHVAWAGFIDGAERPVVDDRVGPMFDHVLDWHWDDEAVTWLAQRGDEIFRVASPA